MEIANYIDSFKEIESELLLVAVTHKFKTRYLLIPFEYDGGFLLAKYDKKLRRFTDIEGLFYYFVA